MAKQNQNKAKSQQANSQHSTKSGKNSRNSRSQSKSGNYQGKQGSKDSSSPRVNMDNMRIVKAKDTVLKKIEEDGKKYNANDASYYTRNPELVRAAGTLPFAPIFGEPNAQGISVPGIMSFAWYPNFGFEEKPLALNQSSDSVYSFVVHANSRNYNYTAPDLTIVTLAGMEVFKILGSAIRAYGVAKAYTEENAFMPDAILTAMGFYPNDVMSSLDDMWFDINHFIDQARQIWIPNNYPILKKQYDMNSFVYTDSPDGFKSQIYLFVQNRYFVYNETSAETGSYLDAVTDNGVPFTKPESTEGTPTPAPGNLFEPANKQYSWADWKIVIQSMIDALINAEDRGNMYGDLLNAYSAQSLYALPPIPADYVVYPAYNAEVLMQIENITSSSAGSTVAPVGLCQYEENLYPTYEVGASSWSLSPTNNILNYHTQEKPDPELVMLGTRYKVGPTVGAYGYVVSRGVNPQFNKYPDQKLYLPSTGGAEYVGEAYLWTYAPGSTNLPTLTNMAIPLSINSPALNGKVTTLARMMAFDWHPFIYSYTNVQPTEWKHGPTLDNDLEVFGDWDNFATVSDINLRRLNVVAMMSLWGVPIL